MDFREAIISQYQAALAMLKQAILACPDANWFEPADVNKFSQIAYHALYWTHARLNESEQTFQPWSGHRDEYRLAGGGVAGPTAPASKAIVLEYLVFCQQQVVEKIAVMDLDTPSGWEDLRMSRFELLLYSLRHIQHHVGELMERLYVRAGIELDWIGTGSEAL